MDDIRIYDRALSEDEVEALFILRNSRPTRGSSANSLSASVVGNIEVTPTIQIRHIPEKLSAFQKAGFSKYVRVFGVHVFATSSTPDVKVLHASRVLAQYLDNDEDGVPDNPLVVSHLVSRNAYLVMTADEHEFHTLHPDDWHDAGFDAGQFLHGRETKPDFPRW